MGAVEGLLVGVPRLGFLFFAGVFCLYSCFFICAQLTARLLEWWDFLSAFYWSNYLDFPNQNPVIGIPEFKIISRLLVRLPLLSLLA